VLAGRGGNSVQTGRIVQSPAETPLCNLYLSMLERAGCAKPSFADSTGPLAL
jgi:hypothetical protein